jgi:hypothetical protein
MASSTQMHNVLCRSVTIEARFTASSRSSGSHRNWTDLYRASNSRVRGVLLKALYVQDGLYPLWVKKYDWKRAFILIRGCRDTCKKSVIIPAKGRDTCRRPSLSLLDHGRLPKLTTPKIAVCTWSSDVGHSSVCVLRSHSMCRFGSKALKC